jgi:hypothetical protein
VHGVQIGPSLPDLEVRQQALPVVGVDRLAARELETDRNLELLELRETLAGEELGDLGFDVRVDLVAVGDAQLLQSCLADGGHGLRSEHRPSESQYARLQAPLRLRVG